MSDVSDLAGIRSYIQTNAQRLDPTSRYVRDLLAIAAESSSASDFEDRLDAGCRGLRHSGRDVFEQMTLEEKILSNLITPETSLFRFSEGEMEAIDRHLLPHLGQAKRAASEASEGGCEGFARAGPSGRKAEILIVPCSHGEEAFTIAAYFLKVGIDFGIRAFDVQPALIDEARTGRLTFGYPVEYLASPGYVARDVMERIAFEVGDAFALPLADQRFDLILCRNFIGYFVEPVAVELVEKLLRRVAPGGVLFLDGFCIQKHGAIERCLLERGAVRLFDRPAFIASAR